MKNGFTLIEGLIILAIISVLAAIAYPAYYDYKKRRDNPTAYETTIICRGGFAFERRNDVTRPVTGPNGSAIRCE